MKRLLVIGNSHVEAVKFAYLGQVKHGPPPIMPVEIVNILEEQYRPPLGDGLALHPAIVEQLAHPDNGLVVSMLGGNDHNTLGLVNHPVPFDFVLPERPDLPLSPTAELVPYGLIRDRLARMMWVLSELLKGITAHARQPVIHLESPPPTPSEEHIRKYPRVFAESIEQHGVAPATLRYKLWRAHSEIFREACAGHGVRFVPAPPAMQDADGMLIPEAWNPDPTHGNTLYGAALIEQAAEIYRETASEPLAAS